MTDKEQYYQKMGWVGCNTCGEVFYEYELYLAHDCDFQGIIPSIDNWTVSNDPTRTE